MKQQWVQAGFLREPTTTPSRGDSKYEPGEHPPQRATNKPLFKWRGG